MCFPHKTQKYGTGNSLKPERSTELSEDDGKREVLGWQNTRWASWRRQEGGGFQEASVQGKIVIVRRSGGFEWIKKRLLALFQ